MAVVLEDIPSPRELVLDHLIRAGKIDAAALERARLMAGRAGEPVERVLNQIGALSDDDLAWAYAECSGRPLWDPEATPPVVDRTEIGVAEEFLRRHRMLPLALAGEELVCAVCDPFDEEALSGVAFAAGRPIALLVARPGDWSRAFGAPDEGSKGAAPTDEHRLARDLERLADTREEGAGARLVTAAFEEAVAARASDIHIEPHRHQTVIRLRVDGRMVNHRAVAPDLGAQAVSRVKVIANLDLGERRLPQDGRTSFVVKGRQIDVRVATAPTVFGESAVLRLLDRTSVPLDLDALGFGEGLSNILRKAVAAPHGLFLVTGPTGSGKTTTLYALLQTFAGSARKILSVEDPVEFHFDHVSQTQVAPGIGLTFASALRAFLRQDPDVIMVGEIRDPETAAVAVQAAMTGHFVLASAHANDALAVIPRLLDLGVEPYQLAAALRGAAAQRLVRRLCESCSEPIQVTDLMTASAEAIGSERPQRLFAARGCASCQGTGFRGRIAIGEGFAAHNDFLRELAGNGSSERLCANAVAGGFVPMAVDGIGKAQLGLTTLDEVVEAVNA